MCLQAVREQALKYLGYVNQTPDDRTEALLNTCFEEVEATATPRFIAQTYPLTHDPLSVEGISLEYPDLTALFAPCHSVCIIGATLGVGVERHCARLGKTDVAKLVVFDAVASSYLEELCDAYEQTLTLGPRTFRYCPGYGAVPLTLNRTLCRALQMDKRIGLTVQPSCLLLPQKSMIGLIGLGAQQREKSCQGCSQLENCAFRKKEQRCYKTQSQNA